MRTLSTVAAMALVSGVGTLAHAQEATTTTSQDPPNDTGEPSRVEMRAPRRALEIGVQGGYTQPFGEIGKGRDIHDNVSAGGAVGLSLGYRATPHWSVEGTGQYHESATGDAFDGTDADIRGVTLGVQATYHFRPYKMVDPYASLGTGYRMMWLVPEGAPNDMVHGFEIAKAVIGVDFRVAPSVAFGPLIGADLDMFVWDNPQGDVANERIDNVRPSTFLFAGVGGRFDVGGDRVPHDRVAREATPIPAAAPPPPAPPPPKQPATGIQIEQRILDICKIEGPKAYFDFDKANVKATDQTTLDQVANCFTTGPLKGRTMRVIGHTDPRGPDDYNEKLGQSRAQSVVEYLGEKGVPNTEMGSESRGEQEATGSDEEGWAYDRRVDLKLAD